MKPFNFFLLILGMAGIFISGHNFGYKSGTRHGIDITLDTVNTLVERHAEDDSTINEWHIECKHDTAVYWLSTKTLHK